MVVCTFSLEQWELMTCKCSRLVMAASEPFGNILVVGDA
jgi:hypothetical protein